jgi:dTDP-4-dehydrorhamnose 3,5-epimerase
MPITPLPLAPAFVVDPTRYTDHRGYLATPYCQKEFENAGIAFIPCQSNVSYNTHAGTLRGLHFQTSPHAQAKLVTCIRGRALDVIVDIRPDSPTCGQWTAVELSEDNARAIYVPKGFAHGFQTLVDDTLIYYLMDASYAPQSSGGYTYNDPAFGITWPLPVSQISKNDQNWPLFSPTLSHVGS